MSSAKQDQWGAWEWVCPRCHSVFGAKAMIYLAPKKKAHMEQHIQACLEIAEDNLR